jgi:hypothetical protein
VTAVGILDTRLLWTGIVWLIGPLMLHAAWWQAVICAICMTAYWKAVILASSMTNRRYLSYCQRAVPVFGVTILLLGLCTWSGILPAADQWRLWHHPFRFLAYHSNVATSKISPLARLVSQPYAGKSAQAAEQH